MNHNQLEQLPRIHREAIESAGYRVLRWVNAREVLQARITKGRITGALGDFLARWLPRTKGAATLDDWQLTFDVINEQIRVSGGSITLVESPLEHALLHLPALRSFWSNELRRQHFMALKAIVPSAWIVDEEPVPSGAVIHGLGITAWDQLERLHGHEWDRRGQLLTACVPAGLKINVRYERNCQGQVVLCSVEAMS